MTARLIYRASDVPAIEPRRATNPKVLLLLSRRGTATQEALLPLVELQRLGIDVVIGSDTAGAIVFDGPCNLLASVERFWSPVHELHRRLQREGLRAEAVNVADLPWLDQFDALLIPGGHGPHYGAFILGPFARAVVRAFVNRGKLVALQCHSVVAAALDGPDGEPPIGQGRQVTCWPNAYERALGSLPMVGRHFLPLGKRTQELVQPVTGRVHVSVNPARMPHVVVDGPLITSWGPWSGELMGRTLAAMIDARSRDAGAFDWKSGHAA